MAFKETKPAGLIAVMGGTGTGKSSFINAILGKDATDVGHGLESQTSDIKEYDFLMKNGLHVTLVDTPGFNDYTADAGGKSDLVILKEIGAFLKAKYDEDRKFSGILYLHNICDPRVGGSLQRNMTMFKKLCGPDPLKNVVVVTTFWDEIELDHGIELETELKTKDRFFKGLVEGESKFVRSGKFPLGEIPKGPEFLPPVSIVGELVALDPVFVEMQKELAEGKTVEETSAGAELYKELQQLKLQQKRDVIDLNQKIAGIKAENIDDRLARKALEDECKALKGQMKEWETRQLELRSEWVIAIAQLKRERETSAKQRDLELENNRRTKLRSEIELLKTLHAAEILECRSQIQSLLDGNSTDAFRNTQLEKTCEDLKATVADLSLSLTKLRDTNEREAAERSKQLRANAATHKKTLDDLAEARSKIAQLNSQLQASQAAQERTATELGKVRSTLASVKNGAEIELNTVRAALADAEINPIASQNTQDNTASELRERVFLEKVISELSAAHTRCEETESQLRESRNALECKKLELVRSPSPLPKESPRSIATPKLPAINVIPEDDEGGEQSAQSPPSLTDVTAKRPPRPRKTTFLTDLVEPSRQPATPPVHLDSRAQRLRSTAPVLLFLANKTNKQADMRANNRPLSQCRISIRDTCST
ncbi:uncharacterized protein LACBIDRAFT_313185 [Laccaria bicolor S238N-H82]|uniref:Predicted protein n=1 Tax=Laccaria bicolor (strain S238N-H82 / ATCC MYA-4686) TaxID=486041 RepID=B0DXR1_LACBS|nr:uncharacterized protein LACBIDRAFT_313185 [Laccaria bicolor S238N-H82]EDR00727.1 predicted protein [Laccaria bicolor S238N-H82]|eukprot:XP_001888736.1 predicted protein [Laccaria bicolor S238N-H82]